jgi:nicotinate-nucleotide adenylyltransferase
MREIEREAEADERRANHQPASAGERKGSQHNVSANPDGRHGHMSDLGIGTAIDDAAVPLLVDGAGCCLSRVVDAQGEVGDGHASHGKQCKQEAHLITIVSASVAAGYDKSMEDRAPSDVPVSGGCPRGARVAFFGGSFDPPHLGHLAIARAARAALGLDCVLFAPVGAQPLKPKGPTASFGDRLAMTELALAGEPGFEISLADAPHAEGRPNYTLDTLRKLRAGLAEGDRLYCLMGADSFASLGRWRGAEEIPFAASLIVASRPGQGLDDLARYLPPGLTLDSQERGATRERCEVASNACRERAAEIRAYLIRNPAGETAPFYLLPGLDVEISASDIRAQVRSHDPTAAGSLPPTVAAYIRTHGLYR